MRQTPFSARSRSAIVQNSGGLLALIPRDDRQTSTSLQLWPLASNERYNRFILEGGTNGFGSSEGWDFCARGMRVATSPCTSMFNGGGWRAGSYQLTGRSGAPVMSYGRGCTDSSPLRWGIGKRVERSERRHITRVDSSSRIGGRVLLQQPPLITMQG